MDDQTNAAIDEVPSIDDFSAIIADINQSLNPPVVVNSQVEVVNDVGKSEDVNNVISPVDNVNSNVNTNSDSVNISPDHIGIDIGQGESYSVEQVVQVDPISPEPVQSESIPADVPKSEEISPDSVQSRPTPPESIDYTKMKDEKGRFFRGVPQDTNKNGTAGRPAFDEDPILEKLREAFLLGCTDEEACLFANISPDWLYKYQKENPEFVDEKEMLKQNPVLLARKTVVNSLKVNEDIAFKYLERKKRDEFALRIESTGKDGKAIEMTLDRLESNYDDLAARAAEALNSTGETKG